MEGFKTKLLAMEQLVRRVEDFTAITKNQNKLQNMFLGKSQI